MSKANSLYHIELNHPDSKWHKEGHQGSSPAPAILLIPYVIRSYNTTKPNKVGLSVIQITKLSKYSK